MERREAGAVEKRMSLPIPIGATAIRTITVTPQLTVEDFAPGMPPVYATAWMIAHMELAAADAIQPYLPEGWRSVGVVVNVKHLAATPIGLTVTAKARVTAVGEREVTFAVESHDGVEKIGEGTHVRAPIDLARFEKRMAQKRGSKP
jgi:fluoroacetyl-CoA thioesterase